MSTLTSSTAFLLVYTFFILFVRLYRPLVQVVRPHSHAARRHFEDTTLQDGRPEETQRGDDRVYENRRFNTQTIILQFHLQLFRTLRQKISLVCCL